MKRSDRIIIRLERAGGSLSETSELLKIDDPECAPLANAVANVNIMVADLRRAVIRIQRGEDIEDVMRGLEDSWRNLWPISAEMDADERMQEYLTRQTDAETTRIRGRGGRAGRAR